MRSTVKYSELYKQLFGLIVIPLTLAAIFILLMYILKLTETSETILGVFILAGSIAVVLVGIFIVKKMVLIDADVEYDMNGVHFQLKNNSFLYKETLISVLYNNIEKISFGDNDNYSIYVNIRTKSPKKIIFISPENSENNASFIAYWDDVANRIKNK